MTVAGCLCYAERREHSVANSFRGLLAGLRGWPGCVGGGVGDSGDKIGAGCTSTLLTVLFRYWQSHSYDLPVDSLIHIRILATRLLTVSFMGWHTHPDVESHGRGQQ